MAYNMTILFQNAVLRDVLTQAVGTAVAKIDGMPANELLQTSETDLIDSLADEHSVEPIELVLDEVYQREPREARISMNTPGVITTIVIPFRGDTKLLWLRPDTFSQNPPRASVEGQEIVLEYHQAHPDAAAVEGNYKSTLDKIQQYLKWQFERLRNHRERIANAVREAISQRKARLLANQNLSAALKIPLKRRDGPATYSVPLAKRKPKIVLPASASAPFAPEPVLEADDYEFILDTMQRMSLVMESNPQVFAPLGEESLRTHFLVPLNASFEASAETFNYEGKTDIMIRHQGRNVFIAECALWKGDEYLTGKINQLLGYSSWRDTKTAILLFSRNKDFSSVLAKIPGVLKSHGNFKKELGQRGETGFKYLFHHRDDRNRELVLTVMAFNVPKLED